MKKSLYRIINSGVFSFWVWGVWKCGKFFNMYEENEVGVVKQRWEKRKKSKSLTYLL